MTNSNQAPSQGHGLDGFYAALRRPGIVRGTNDRWFAGVAGGIARWLGVDPLVVRAGFILFSIFFGIGVTLYLVLWLLMPDDRGRLPVERALKDGDGGSIFLLVITGLAVLGGAPWWGGDYHGARIVGFALLVLGAWWFLTRTDTGRDLMVNKPWRGGGAGVGGSGASTGNAAANAGAAFGAGSTPGTPGTPGTTASVGDPGTAPTSGATGGAGFASSPNQPWTAQAPFAAPPRERVRSIGFAGGLLVLGLALVSGVIAHQVATTAGWAGNPTAIGIAAGVGVLGLAIVIGGLAGRRAGGLAFFTVVGMIAAVATTAAPAGLTRPFQVGDPQHVVTSLAGDPNFQLGLGEMTVDLSKAEYQATALKPDVVTATMGVGQLTIVVPQGVPVTVNTRARLGEVDAPAGSEAQGSSMRTMDDPSRVATGGPDVAETLTLGPKGAAPEIVVDAEVGMGQILVRSAS
ncbi:PspC domain-containing protein [Humibacillus xanthopallidus]|nr:PspC domain-containing protein [Humibacillus xanthopallidus]